MSNPNEPHALTAGTSLGTSPSWHSIAFAIPLAMLAYTGLETVANLAEETRRPGRDLPRSLFGAIGLPAQARDAARQQLAPRAARRNRHADP